MFAQFVIVHTVSLPFNHNARQHNNPYPNFDTIPVDPGRMRKFIVAHFQRQNNTQPLMGLEVNSTKWNVLSRECLEFELMQSVRLFLRKTKLHPIVNFD